MKMKRMNRILGITLAITLPVTIILFSIAAAMSVNGAAFAEGEAKIISEQYANVETVSISNMIDEVEVIAADTKEVSVDYKGKNEVIIEYSDTTKTLTIETKAQPKWFNFSFGFFNEDNNKLTVTVPKELKAFISKGGVGDTSVTGISAEQLTLEMGVGNVALNTITIENTATIKGGVGNLEVKKLSATTLGIQGGVGNIELDEISISGVTTLKSGIGNCEITNSVLNTLEGSMGIGNLDLQGTTIEHNSISNGIGNISF